MDRRTVLALAGTACAGVVGCLEAQRTTSGTSDERSESHDADAETAAEGSGGASEPRSPTATIEAFADAITTDDIDAVRELTHPDSSLSDELGREELEPLTVETLDVEPPADDAADGTATDGDEVTVDVVWTISDADGTEWEEDGEKVHLQATLRRDENAWTVWDLERESDRDVGVAAQAGVTVDIDADARTATVMLVSLSSADGVVVTGNGDRDADGDGAVGSCGEPLETVGDSCRVVGPGHYTAVAYVGPEPDAGERETVVATFEIDE